MVSLDNNISWIHSSRVSLVLTTIVECATLLKFHKNFEDVFLIKYASHLPTHKDHNHTIYFAKSAKLPHFPIYNRPEN